MTQEKLEKIRNKIKPINNLQELVDADVFIETIIEQIEPKKDLFIILDKVCKPETIFVSNTSGWSITEMAGTVEKSVEIIGMHFFPYQSLN